MIIARQKPTEELLDMLAGYDKIALIGCAGCVTFYGVGGKKETIAMAEKLTDEGKKVVSTGISIKQCFLCEEKEVESLEDADILRKVAREIEGFLRLEEVEAVISLACGVGVQNLANILDGVPVLPAQDTMFMGRRRVEKDFDLEQCIGCGNCILGYTGGICPVTRCAKSLMNGPCGGVTKGNCEVSQAKITKHPVPCAWIEIYNKLKKQGKLDNMRKIRPAKDFTESTHMRKLEVD